MSNLCWTGAGSIKGVVIVIELPSLDDDPNYVGYYSSAFLAKELGGLFRP